MSVVEDLNAVIGSLSPDAVCDDWIAERLGLSVRQHANHQRRELAGRGEFVRVKSECSMCGGTKVVIGRA